MTRYNPFEKSPSFETEHFALRLVRPGDAGSLLKCYSDPEAGRFFNADCCTNDFRYDSIDEMSRCIAFWRDSYKEKRFIRLTILRKSSQEPVGTLEVFGGDYHDEQVAIEGDPSRRYDLVRVDVRSDYENSETLTELFNLAVTKFYDEFAFDMMLTKAIPEAGARLDALKSLGFEKTNVFRPGLHYYSRPQKPAGRLGIAYCGLACCVCSENSHCQGCRDGGCRDREWCANLKCCRDKGLRGCWECDRFPCSGNMLDKPRVCAFARFVKEYGEDKLVTCLLRNKSNGVVYHYDGQLVGDYDQCHSDDEIFRMILRGK
jgi:hypothetical protein